MTRANVARQHGDTFQARLFWLKAVNLLDDRSPIRLVAYETGPKSFDDILVEYDPAAAPPDHDGHPIGRRHIQCKWHATAGSFGYADLVDPGFINAERFSILERARQALEAVDDGQRCRFELVTNWRLAAGDPLQTLVRKESNALDARRLEEGKTDRSRMGKVRRVWREHLGTDDAQLREIANVLTIGEMPESLERLRELLDERFSHFGMRRIPASESAFLYDDLAAKLLAQGRCVFDRDSFRELCAQEGLLTEVTRKPSKPAIGVRSFMHPINPMEERCDEFVNFVPLFDGRYIRNPADWNDRLLPELEKFVVGKARAADEVRLVIDAHVSLAVATGSVLGVKSGKNIEIEQRTSGRRFWSMADHPVDHQWPQLKPRFEALDTKRPDLALAIGLTHGISAAVDAFVKRALPQVGAILQFEPEGGPSQLAVRCGRHAWILAESVVQQTRVHRAERDDGGMVHLFIAGPNGFAFFLGQQRQALGPVRVYEWDFDGRQGGSYSLGVSLGD